MGCWDIWDNVWRRYICCRDVVLLLGFGCVAHFSVPGAATPVCDHPSGGGELHVI
ncbi:MAG: hypothetical protein KF679_13590 [Chitinophagaceae bacterium]|nr:hypothetical protein [Chitinophagaceae bacterium]